MNNLEFQSSIKTKYIAQANFFVMQVFELCFCEFLNQKILFLNLFVFVLVFIFNIRIIPKILKANFYLLFNKNK